MRRGVKTVLGILFVAGLVAAVPAAAGAAPGGSAPAASGTLTCALSGGGQFSPALPSASNENGSAGKIKFKLKADLASCDSTGVSGGKMPITGGSVQFQATLDPGSGCLDIIDFGSPDFTSNVAKMTVKLTGTAPNGKHPKVANLTVKSDGFSNDSIPKGWEIDSDSFPSARASAAFPDESAVLDLILDTPSLQHAGACALGGDDLTSVAFGPGSTFTLS
jgi:hypothetical protein